MNKLIDLDLPSYGARNVALVETSQDGRSIFVHFENDKTLKKFTLCFPHVLYYRFTADSYVSLEGLGVPSEAVFEYSDGEHLQQLLGASLEKKRQRWPFQIRCFAVRFQDFGFYEIISSDALMVEK